MKILAFPLLLAVIFFCIHLARLKKSNKKIWIVVIVLTIGLFGFLSYKFYLSLSQPDTQCTIPHKTATSPATKLQTENDFFMQGNYDYDSGSCKKAIMDYTNSINLNPTRAEVYNNRAYTYMRMQDYKNALPDLDKAITLRPNYVNALINRGDIYNFYYNVDHSKALSDYNKVIALGVIKGNSVCGHKAMAMSQNFIPLAFLRIFMSLNCK